MNILKKGIGLLFTTNDDVKKREQVSYRNEPEFDWQYLVTPGHTTFARINYLTFIGRRFLIFFILSCFIANFAIIFSERLMYAGLAKKEHVIAKVKKEVDSTNIINRSRQFNGKVIGEVTLSKDLPDFIEINLESLHKKNKLGIPCNQTQSISKLWSDNKNSIDYPMCLIKAGTKSVPPRAYVFAIVKDGYDYKNWLGVFFKANGKWHYKNIAVPKFYTVSGQQSFITSDVINTLKIDFSDLPVTEEK